MRLSTLLLASLPCLLGAARADIQTPFLHPDAVVEDQLYSATQQWLQADTQAMSCAKCISVLQMVKNLSYMSEAMLIGALVRVCQRTQKVDTDVVRT